MTRHRITSAVVISLLVLAAQGCGKKSAPATNPTLEPILTTWRQGDKSAAISRFVDTDWTARPLFAPGSAIAMSEPQFEALSKADQEAKSKEFMPVLPELRALGVAVLDAGKAAATKGDPAAARKHFTAVQRCGEALSDANHLTI